MNPLPLVLPVELTLVVNHRISRAAYTWQEFIQLPLEIKQKFSFRSYRTKDHDDGYRFREGDSNIGRYDKKEFFHMTAELIHAARYAASEITECDYREIALRFISAAEALLVHMQPLGACYLKKLVAIMPTDESRKQCALLLQEPTTQCLRFLHYFPTENETYAAQHVDFGGMTVHLHETSHGVEYLDRDGQWVSMALTIGQTIGFAGVDLQARLPVVDAACHRVRRMIPSSGSRSAIVLFSDFLTECVQKSVSLQTLHPGFNYGLSREDLLAAITKIS